MYTVSRPYQSVDLLKIYIIHAFKPFDRTKFWLKMSRSAGGSASTTEEMYGEISRMGNLTLNDGDIFVYFCLILSLCLIRLLIYQQ